MKDRFDILTIYDFYDELGTRINDLLNYCIKNIEYNFIIEELSYISKKYRDYVIGRMADEVRYAVEGFTAGDLDADDII